MNTRSYSTELSYIHDAGFGDFSRRAGKHILTVMRERNIRNGHVVDLGCGSGIWAELLHKHHYAVTGVDISPAMIALSKKRVPQGKFSTGSLYTFRIPPCDVITSLGECFTYTFDGAVGERKLAQLFAQCYSALSPGGLLVFDLLIVDKKLSAPYKTFVEGNDWLVTTNVSIDQRKRKLTRKITSFVKKGSLYSKTYEQHTVQLFHKEMIVQSLRNAGFKVKTTTSYGAMKLRPGHAAFIAHK